MIEHDIESENLPAHVSICQERYRSLERRLLQVETGITQIHTVLRDIRDDIQDIRDHHSQRWNSAQIATIGVLMSALGAMATGLWL